MSKINVPEKDESSKQMREIVKRMELFEFIEIYQIVRCERKEALSTKTSCRPMEPTLKSTLSDQTTPTPKLKKKQKADPNRFLPFGNELKSRVTL